MKFIFPQNYSFNSKLFGVIDYSTAIFDVIWCSIIFLLVNLFFSDINLKIVFIVIFTFPILLISFFGFNHEKFLYVLFYFFKFIQKQKLYLYNK